MNNSISVLISVARITETSLISVFRANEIRTEIRLVTVVVQLKSGLK